MTLSASGTQAAAEKVLHFGSAFTTFNAARNLNENKNIYD